MHVRIHVRAINAHVVTVPPAHKETTSASVYNVYAGQSGIMCNLWASASSKTGSRGTSFGKSRMSGLVIWSNLLSTYGRKFLHSAQNCTLTLRQRSSKGRGRVVKTYG